ncbi:YbdD/YjiX family protein [Polaromonas jejuensis]|uniref:YbdD/YjiX family protein n=1 Tax=Polaromonas jejuensis TaxID=457502 RepID=A0ABW0QFS1_9BURK|nr:YbdD/YjiX family protein [Polaromonas jejuensis]
MLKEIASLGQSVGSYLGQTARLMVGVPNYGTYVAHQRREHPDQPVMSYEAFFRERQEARYGDKGRVGRCC